MKSWTQLSDFTLTFHFHALEKEMATHFSVLAWRIPGTGEPGRLPSMGLHRVRHNWRDLAAAALHGKNPKYWNLLITLLSPPPAKQTQKAFYSSSNDHISSGPESSPGSLNNYLFLLMVVQTYLKSLISPQNFSITHTKKFLRKKE